MSGLDDPEVPRPRVVRRRLPFSAVWIVPVVAALIAVGLAMSRIAREGPTVTIRFKSASGVEAGKTPIRYKDVSIGLVTAVRLSPDFDRVEVEAKIAKEAANLMTEGASFWIVRPRVTLSEVSGLGTLLSGNYIGFDRGKADQPRRQFDGLETARVIAPGTPGRQFIVHARDAQRIDIGLPVYFRGLLVGQVAAFDLAPDGHAVDLKIFVNAPYDRNVHPGSRFWDAGGVDVSVDATGLNVRTESLVSLLVGGLAFDNGPQAEAQGPAEEGAGFSLYRDRGTAMKHPDPNERRFVLYFDESLQGLAPGSPVTFLGIPAGEVTKVGIAFDKVGKRLRGRLEITFSPERLLDRLPSTQIAEAREIDRSASKRDAFLREMVLQRGLRAQLRSASLITGQHYVAFDYFPRSAPPRIQWDQEPLELPVVAGVLPGLEQKLGAFLEKIESLPLGEMAGDAREVMREARLTLKSVNGLARDIDERALPGFVAAVENARSALDSAERMMDGASTTLVGRDAPGQMELRSALQELTRAARSLRTLADSLERHPESLLRGRTAEAVSQ